MAKQLSNGVTFLMKKHKIDVLEGTARLEKGSPSPKVIVEKGKGEGTYTAKNVMLATGARAREIPDAGLKVDGKTVWAYREAMVPTEMPKQLLVIGSGAIGIEFASFYRTLGVEVTVVEALDRILPVEDAEISAFMAKQLGKQGIKFLTSAQVKSLKVTRAGRRPRSRRRTAAQTIEADKVILAVGIVGNVENLGLEALGVKVEKTHIVVDGFGKTNVPGLYAIGDVTGPPWLAHKAMHEGVVVRRRHRRQGAAPQVRPVECAGLHLFASAGRERRADGRGGEGDRHEAEGRQVPVHRQWQGDRAGRAGRHREDDLRRRDRRTAGRAHGGRGRHRADPGLSPSRVRAS